MQVRDGIAGTRYDTACPGLAAGCPNFCPTAVSTQARPALEQHQSNHGEIKVPSKTTHTDRYTRRAAQIRYAYRHAEFDVDDLNELLAPYSPRAPRVPSQRVAS